MTDFKSLRETMHIHRLLKRMRAGYRVHRSALFCISATMISCGDTAQDKVWGQYRLDVDKAMSSPLLSDVHPEVKTSLEDLAHALSETLVYEFSAEGCAYIRGDTRSPFECEYVRTEKSDIVVLRSQNQQGLTSYLRLRPTEDGIELDRLNQTIDLKRVSQ